MNPEQGLVKTRNYCINLSLIHGNGTSIPSEVASGLSFL
jgi:hypothetical protein